MSQYMLKNWIYYNTMLSIKDRQTDRQIDGLLIITLQPEVELCDYLQ